MSGTVARLARPNISNCQKRDLFKYIYIGTFGGLAAGLAFWYGYAVPWQNRCEEFFLNYDPFEDFERMRKLGLFQGAPPDEVIKEMKDIPRFKNRKF